MKLLKLLEEVSYLGVDLILNDVYIEYTDGFQDSIAGPLSLSRIENLFRSRKNWYLGRSDPNRIINFYDSESLITVYNPAKSPFVLAEFLAYEAISLLTAPKGYTRYV